MTSSPIRRAMLPRPCWCLAIALVAACGSDSAGADARPPVDAPPALPYTELYARYFADGTIGHCAKSGCHSDPDHNIWLCGPTKDSCYNGMVAQGLIDPINPQRSLIGDVKNSPINWVNPSGPMPFDQPTPTVPFPEGRAAILAWVAAGAKND